MEIDGEFFIFEEGYHDIFYYVIKGESYCDNTYIDKGIRATEISVALVESLCLSDDHYMGRPSREQFIELVEKTMGHINVELDSLKRN